MQGEEEEWGWIGELIRALPEGDDGGRVLTAIGHLLAERGFTGRAYRV